MLKKQGNTAGNINNWGLVATQDNQVYSVKETTAKGKRSAKQKDP